MRNGETWEARGMEIVVDEDGPRVTRQPTEWVLIHGGDAPSTPEWCRRAKAGLLPMKDLTDRHVGSLV